MSIYTKEELKIIVSNESLLNQEVKKTQGRIFKEIKENNIWSLNEIAEYLKNKTIEHFPKDLETSNPLAYMVTENLLYMHSYLEDIYSDKSRINDLTDETKSFMVFNMINLKNYLMENADIEIRKHSDIIGKVKNIFYKDFVDNVLPTGAMTKLMEDISKKIMNRDDQSEANNSANNYFMLTKVMENLSDVIFQFLDEKQEDEEEIAGVDTKNLVSLLLLNNMEDMNSFTLYDERYGYLLNEIIDEMKKQLLDLKNQDKQIMKRESSFEKINLTKSSEKNEILEKEYNEALIVSYKQIVSVKKIIRRVITMMDAMDVENLEQTFDKLVDLAISIDKDNIKTYVNKGFKNLPSVSFLLYKNNIITNELLDFIEKSPFEVNSENMNAESLYSNIGFERSSSISSSPLFMDHNGGENYEIMNNYLKIGEKIADGKVDMSEDLYVLLLKMMQVHYKFESTQVNQNLLNQLRNIPEKTLINILTEYDEFNFDVWQEYKNIMKWKMQTFEMVATKNKEDPLNNENFLVDKKSILGIKATEKDFSKIIEREEDTMSIVYSSYLNNTQRNIITRNNVITLMNINNLLEINYENFKHYNEKKQNGDDELINIWDSKIFEEKLLTLSLFRIVSDMIEFERELSYRETTAEVLENMNKIIESMNMSQYKEMFDFFKTQLKSSLHKTAGYDIYQRNNFKSLDVGLNKFGLNMNFAEIDDTAKSNFEWNDFEWINYNVDKFSTNRMDLVLSNKNKSIPEYFERTMKYYDRLITDETIPSYKKKKEINMLISYWELEDNVGLNRSNNDCSIFEYIKAIVKKYVQNNTELNNNLTDNDLYEKYIPNSHKQDSEIQEVFKDFFVKFAEFSKTNKLPFDTEEIELEIANVMEANDGLIGHLKSKFNTQVSMKAYTKQCICEALHNLSIEMESDKVFNTIENFLEIYNGKTSVDDDIEKIKFWKEKIVDIYKVISEENKRTKKDALLTWFFNNLDSDMFGNEEIKYLVTNKNINFSNVFFLNNNEMTEKQALSLGARYKVGDYDYESDNSKDTVTPRANILRKEEQLLIDEMKALKENLTLGNMLKMICVGKHVSEKEIFPKIWSNPETPEFSFEDITKMIEKTSFSKLSKKDDYEEGIDHIFYILMDLCYLKIKEGDIEKIAQYLVDNVIEDQGFEAEVRKIGYTANNDFTTKNFLSLNILMHFIKNKKNEVAVENFNVEKDYASKLFNKLIELKDGNESLNLLNLLTYNFRNNKDLDLKKISFKNIHETNLTKEQHYTSDSIGEQEKITKQNIEVLLKHSKKGNWSYSYTKKKLSNEIDEDGLNALYQESMFGQDIKEFVQNINDLNFDEVTGGNYKVRQKIIDGILGEVAFRALEVEAAINVLNIRPQQMMGSPNVCKLFHLGKQHLFEDLVSELVGQNEALSLVENLVEKMTKKAYLKAFSGSAFLVIESIGATTVDMAIEKYASEADVLIKENLSTINIRNVQNIFYTSEKENKIENFVIPIEADCMIAKNEMLLKNSFRGLWDIFDSERKRLLLQFLTGQTQSRKEYFVKIMMKEEGDIKKHIREIELFEQIKELPIKKVSSKKKI